MLKIFFKRTFSTFIIGAISYALLMSYSFPVLGQSPPNPIEDSLQIWGWTYVGGSGIMQFDTSQLGTQMWAGACQRTLPTDTNKIQSVFFNYCENGCVRTEAQFDISQKQEDYCIRNYYYGSQCDSIWSEEIAIQTNNNGEITINTPVDVIVEIYKTCKYSTDPPIMKFLATGTGSNQNFQVNLANTVSYIVVFRNSEYFIVNIKRIGGI